MMEVSADEEVEYPFSKARVYFSLVAGILTFFLTVPILFEVAGYVWVLVFLLVSTVMVVASFKLKVYLSKRMWKMEENQSLFDKDRSALFDRNFVVLIFIVAVALGLPILLSAVISAYLTFLGLATYVAGFLLSEPLFYLHCKRLKAKERF